MSLEYGFGLYARTEEETKANDEKFKALSDDDRDFYHNHLCWILMGADIGKVTEKTIPHIISRVKVYHPEMFKEYNKEEVKYLSTEYLSKFIGYTANVCTTSSAEFLKKILKVAKRDLLPLSQKDVDTLYKGD